MCFESAQGRKSHLPMKYGYHGNNVGWVENFSCAFWFLTENLCFFPTIVVHPIGTVKSIIPILCTFVIQIIQVKSRVIKPPEPSLRPSETEPMVRLTATVGATLKQALDKQMKELSMKDSRAAGGELLLPQWSEKNCISLSGIKYQFTCLQVLNTG